MFKIQSIYMNPTGTYSSTMGSAKIFRIYKNPKAKELFIKAQNSSNIEERKKLFAEMGEYKVVVEKDKEPSKNRFLQLLRGLFSKY